MEKNPLGDKVKILIQSLGEVPATIEFAIEKEKPDVTHIICSEDLMKNIPSIAGYTESSQIVIERAAKKCGTKVVWEKCDIFDMRSVGDAIGKVVKEINPKDDVVINYTGGAASVKLLLGASAMALSKHVPIRIIYALRYKGGTEVFKDQTAELKTIFKQLYKFF